jgi:hypothetical protein
MVPAGLLLFSLFRAPIMRQEENMETSGNTMARWTAGVCIVALSAGTRAQRGVMR